MKPDEHLCSICGEAYAGIGYDAEPVAEGRCCKDCEYVVIARRIKELKRLHFLLGRRDSRN